MSSIERRKAPGEAWETVGVSNGGSQPVTQVRVPISAAQILALFSNPVELVAAPGAGSALVPLAISVTYLAGTTAYDQSYAMSVDWEGSTLNQISVSPNIDALDDTFEYGLASSESSRPVAEAEDQPLIFWAGDGQDPTLGDGTLVVVLTYTTVQVA